MGLINIHPIDQADLEQIDFDPDMKRWMTNLIDTVNSNFTTLNQALAITSADIGGGGAGPGPGPLTVTVPGMIPAGTVTVNLLFSTNPVSIVSVVPGTNQFTITFSANPGGSAIIQYTAFAVGL